MLNQFVQKVTSENFAEILKTDKPVLVDFHATWCGPCKMISSFIDEIAEELHQQAVVAKVDIDECPDLAEEYDVMTVPTLIVFKQGKVVRQETGARPKQVIKAMISDDI